MKPLEDISIEEEWLKAPKLQRLFDLLTADGGEAMIAGGAVRNALMGERVADIDLCTTLVPQEVMDRLESAGEKAVPTGFDHGTVTAVVDGSPFEVTTLREDIETDGRHAIVKFGTDWETDAKRRDLTINGLYCDRNGRVFDFVDGYKDIADHNVRFIGDAKQRIEEDSLRILRFFRFFAWYGGGRPDAEGLKACNACKKLLGGLSVERVWMELKKLLSAPDPGRALLWMRTTGILGGLIPETVKWGIDAIPGLVRLEQEQGWAGDLLLRLMAMVRPDLENVQGLAKRLNLSNAERERLENWAQSSVPAYDIESGEFDKLLYNQSISGTLDAMKLEVVHLRNREEDDSATQMLGLIEHAQLWNRPVFPIKGQDLLDAGFRAGPDLGRKLAMLEDEWIESGFALTRQELLQQAQ
ncbi:MAG: CCA tRNA nucleotidyltransferase [Pseudomonadota bacterium]